MKVSARAGGPATESEREKSDATVKAGAAWIAQLARTLKTCRLYDAANPTVVRFRAEFAEATGRLLQDNGPLTFQFTADDVTLDGVSLYPARSRDDNLAYPFHRDGVRALTIRPGIDDRDVGSLVDAVLAATGQNLDDDDLVTLLWEANLTHIDVDYVPAEGDVGGGPNPVEDGATGLLPWPDPGSVEDAPAPAPEAAATPAGPATERSEDWTLGDLTVEAEATYIELDSLAPAEVERFRREYAAEHAVAPVMASLAVCVACLHADAQDDDRVEIAGFLPRVLRAGVSAGAWPESREALRLVRSIPDAPWSEETFAQELLQPVAIARAVQLLDTQGEEAHAAFLGLAEDLGDPGLDWATLMLSESQQQPARMAVAEWLAERCRTQPERLAPWLEDERWYVVRNIVCILGWIGGSTVIGLLKGVVRHPDRRVREQLVASLSGVELRHARPLLVHALDGAETRPFCQILHQLSQARDPATARFLFAFLQQDRFPTRPVEERRAIYAAIASVGGDEIVHELELEMLRSNWFDRAQEIHRHNVARCLARIGTPHAREVLEAAARSRRAPVRQAAAMALATLVSP